jgi:hypothetical protein
VPLITTLKPKKRKKEEKVKGVVTCINGGNRKIYISEGSQALPARPSAKDSFVVHVGGVRICL